LFALDCSIATKLTLAMLQTLALFICHRYGDYFFDAKHSPSGKRIMFGCIVPQHTLPLTGFVQVDALRWLLDFPIPISSDIQEVLVFLSGISPLPEGYGASIYVSLQGSGLWSYLGHIHNGKVNDLFRIPPQDAEAAASATSTSGSYFSQQRGVQGIAQLGIEVEPLSQIQNRESGQVSSLVRGAEYDVQVAKYVANDLVQYLSSFAQNGLYGPDTLVMPVTALNAWLEKFVHRLQRDRHFWKKP
jgi:hypothetical protein